MGENRENVRGLVRPTNFRDMGNRRALREIKILGVDPPFPCGLTKRQELTGKSCTGAENQVVPARRPITRRFADSLAGKSQACPQQGNAARYGVIGERRKRSISSVVDSDVSDTYAAIHVEEHKPAKDLPMSMVEEMEDVVKVEIEEIEMEDLVMEPMEDQVVEPLPDIDSVDSENPLAVVEYVEQIYDFYRRTETSGCVSPDYMSHQVDINERMRAILVDWLIEVHYKFELLEETLYLTVNIIDRFLAKQSVVRKKLQLVGVTALLLACKYEEVSVPVVEDLILISDRAYTREQVLEMEKLIVNTLQFNMSVPTPYVFMRRTLKAAQSDKKVELLSFFMMELCLVEYQMLKYRPSMLAAAAVYTAQSTIKGFKHWTTTCELHSNYSQEQLLVCSRLMVDFHQKAGVGKLTGVHRKYNTFKFGCAAKSEPALFLLDNTL